MKGALDQFEKGAEIKTLFSKAESVIENTKKRTLSLSKCNT